MREEKGTNKYRIKGQSVMEKRLSMGYTQEKLGELTGFSRTKYRAKCNIGNGEPTNAVSESFGV